MSGYPAPRYPRLKRPKSVEELMPKARELFNQPPEHGFMSLKPDYGIKKGSKVLFVVLSEYDTMVIEAVCQAMREKGAKVDLLTLDSTPVSPPDKLAAHEAIAIGKEEDDYSYYYTGICNLLRPSTARALVEKEKYDMVIGGLAGPQVVLPVPWHKYNFVSLEDFAGPMFEMPLDVLTLINKTTFDKIMSCQTIRMVDPEGTDIRWTNYKEGRPFMENHVLARPWYVCYPSGKDDCEGYIGGTLNHLSAFPHCTAYFEGGQVVKVEGGGYYGDCWREKLEKYRKTKMPSMPAPIPSRKVGRYAVKGEPEYKTYEVKEPGFFWFIELAIGSMPGAFRLPREGTFQCYGNFIHDRWRAGYIHNGFGAFSPAQQEMIDTGLPWTHLHIHSQFATLSGKTSKGEEVVIVDKGHLTALDDPEVRALASRYADPDKLLKEVWFPAVPGINAPGDYMKDYARDPISWIKKETLEHPVWLD